MALDLVRGLQIRLLRIELQRTELHLILQQTVLSFEPFTGAHHRVQSHAVQQRDQGAEPGVLSNEAVPIRACVHMDGK